MKTLIVDNGDCTCFACAASCGAADLQQLLTGLGDTPDAVADRLRALDIKGKQVSACHCPIARYVRVHGGFVGVSANHFTVLVNAHGSGIRPPVEVVTPSAVRRFMDRFDDGMYLDLVVSS